MEDGARIAELIRTAVGQVDGAAAAEETFWAIRRFIEELARDQPLLVCLDDVHWASPTLLDLIEYLAGWLRAPVLLLVLARPDLSSFGRAGRHCGRMPSVRGWRPLDDTESDRCSSTWPRASSSRRRRVSGSSPRRAGTRSSSSRWSRWQPKQG